MNEVVIQLNVRICPECGGELRFNQLQEIYQCYHCGNKYKYVSPGQTEREVVCEKLN